MNVNAGGSPARPASSGEYPRPNWKYWVTRKKKPNITKNATVITALPVLKRRSRNRFSGNIG